MRKAPSLISIPVLLFAFLFYTGCMTKKQRARMYINDDSTDVYSTHSSRPFKYGYALDLEGCEEIRDGKLKYFGIQNGDVVADIGAASGWLEGAFSVFVDSVSFYIQDVDTHYLNQDQLNRVVTHFSALRSSPQTNTFQMVIGTEKKTNLPDSIFDIIIIHNTFHEILNPWKIVEDLKSKLKPTGKIIVYDAFSNNYKKIKHAGCGIKALKVEFVSEIFLWNYLYLTHMSGPESSLNNYLTFELDYEKANTFYAKEASIKTHMDTLARLNSKAINRDSMATMQIAIYLKDYLTDHHPTYPTLELYTNELASYLFKEGDTLAAKNVFQVNTILFPTSFYAYDNFADICLIAKQYAASLTNFQKSLELNPDNTYAKEKIRMLNDSLNIRN